MIPYTSRDCDSPENWDLVEVKVKVWRAELDEDLTVTVHRAEQYDNDAILAQLPTGIDEFEIINN